MTTEEHKIMLEQLRRQKKTEQIGFRCTRELRQYIDTQSDVLQASISDTITYMLSYFIMRESEEAPSTLHIHRTKWKGWVDEQARKNGMTVTEYLETLIAKEHASSEGATE